MRCLSRNSVPASRSGQDSYVSRAAPWEAMGTQWLSNNTRNKFLGDRSFTPQWLWRHELPVRWSPLVSRPSRAGLMKAARSAARWAAMSVVSERIEQLRIRFSQPGSTANRLQIKISPYIKPVTKPKYSADALIKFSWAISTSLLFVINNCFLW